MTNDLAPLEYMGTQSRETMNMDAALAAKAALEEARHAPRTLADRLHDVAESGAATYLRADPVRAVLIAAGAGALLMIVAARMARSGARAVRRRVRR